MTTTLHTVAVIGGGTMGAGIAEVAAQQGKRVKLYDINPTAVTGAIEGIIQRLDSRLQRGKISAAQRGAILASLIPVYQLSDLADADLVIEAAVENLEIKQQLFEKLEAICSEKTLFTSNTSSISITNIARHLAFPQRVAGLHFFNPAPVMKLVEVVRGVETTETIIQQLVDEMHRWGKQPVTCHSTPGFIVNRVARPFYAEAWRALEDRVAAPEVIDSALRDAGGFAMGPLALTDLIGQDVNFAVTCSVYHGFWQDRRFLPSLAQQSLVSAGRLGKKSGRGVYDWSLPHPEVIAEKTVASRVQKVNVYPAGKREVDGVSVVPTEGETATCLAVRHQQPTVVYDLSLGSTIVLAAASTNTRQQTESVVHYFQQQGKTVLLITDYPGLLVSRTVAMIINEALDALQKGIASAEDIDIAMQTGVNYPKGPLAWGGEWGWGRVLTLLENLQHYYGEERYRPCPLLRQKALLAHYALSRSTQSVEVSHV
ncbi:3-hydroxyacyl-CoA dehydrogenase [Rosenbergiella nectarea]|uniref:3-hydroxyacyl-CoA dehydrogenase n=1 Tax=Rosenbergiella nectarea TaxID=988801 RepID=UPI001BD9F09D|nr:3-hydroxyacyl-CoA dehydrogenase [Rosenbergiella nectarea]MBT0730199.1 3-hydroxyacyl-CoA dehydrogenase [Rosenbergiella nectarea subsp. apis]